MKQLSIFQEKPCAICGTMRGLKPTNPNIWDGFYDTALRLFVGWCCKRNPKYLKLKE